MKVIILLAILGLTFSASFRGATYEGRPIGTFYNIGRRTESSVPQYRAPVRENTEPVHPFYNEAHTPESSIPQYRAPVRENTEPVHTFENENQAHKAGNSANREGAETPQSNYGKAVIDGANTVGDAIKGDYGDTIVNGVHTLTDLIPQHTGAGQIAGDVGRFVTQHVGVVSNGVNAASSAVQGNYAGVVGDGLHAIADAIPKNNIVGKAIGSVSNIISKAKSGYGGAIEEGINTAADVATGNVGGAVISAAHGVGDLLHGIGGIFHGL